MYIYLGRKIKDSHKPEASAFGLFLHFARYSYGSSSPLDPFRKALEPLKHCKGKNPSEEKRTE